MTSPTSSRSPTSPTPLVKLLDAGCPPLALGRIVPSPYPGCLHALLLNTATLYGLFHSDAVQNPFAESSKSQVRYLPQWKLEDIVNESIKAEIRMGKRAHDTVYTQEKASRLQLLTNIQRSVADEYAQLKLRVEGWVSEDAKENFRRKCDMRTLVRLDLDFVEKAGGLVMQSFWRNELGWKESKSSRLVNRAKKHEYYYEVAVDSSDTLHGSKQIKRKFVWDFEHGKWIRAPNCPIAKEKKLSARMAILEPEIGRIRETRDRALQEIGLGAVVNLRADGNVDFSAMVAQVNDNNDGNSTVTAVQSEEVPATPTGPKKSASSPEESIHHAKSNTQEIIEPQGNAKRHAATDNNEGNPVRKKRRQTKKPRFLRSLKQIKK